MLIFSPIFSILGIAVNDSELKKKKINLDLMSERSCFITPSIAFKPASDLLPW